MKISYITTYNALDLRNWSGLGYNIGKALTLHNADLEYIGVLPASFDSLTQFRRLALKGLGMLALGDRTPFIASSYAKCAEKKIPIDTDIVFSPGSIVLAKMQNRFPKVLYTDATFAGTKKAINVCNQLEQQALNNCDLAIYSSDWAAKTAIDNYDVNPEKVKVVPFGANLKVNRNATEVKDLVERRSRSVCKLLFIGVDWHRKGGDMSLSIAETLNRWGVSTELHIVGINKIPVRNMPSFVRHHGFLDKNSAKDAHLLDLLFKECHFFLLPSLADCSPVVFSEASSYGLPSVATDVGGISTTIKNGINGQVFPLTAEPEVFARFIGDLFNDGVKYRQLAHSSFNRFENLLNWDLSGKTIVGLMKDLVTRGKDMSLRT